MFAQYLRARDHTKLFAVQGVLNTVLVIAFNILFLVVAKIGVIGYVLSVVVSDLLVSVFLFIKGKLYKDISWSSVSPSLMKDMLKYSVPMIPATIFWWITSVSDRYMVTYFAGETVNGLYSAAYKIPTLLTLVSTVFMEAWQYSAVNETDTANACSEETSGFFGSVFSHYQSLMFVAGSAIKAPSQPFIIILCADSYFEAWRYIPFLTVSSIFSGFTAFVGSVYLVKKKSMMTFLTSMAGALINVVLNLILIPTIEAQGAAIATLVSYFAVFVIRAVNTRRYVPFSLSLIRMTVSFFVLIAQALLILYIDEYAVLTQMGVFLIVALINLVPFVKGTRALLESIRKK
jgi:O-antigen/teichoic acid export membrane protein